MIAKDNKILTLAKETSETGYVRIRMKQPEEVCKNLHLEKVNIQGQEYVKSYPEKSEL